MAELGSTASSATDGVQRIVILGSGPAGLTSAIYAARAQLAPLVFHGDTPGGQLITTTVIENFPGFVQAPNGQDLIEQMQKQAEHFGAKFEYGLARKVEKKDRHLELTLGDGKVVLTKALIVSTGARPRKLGLPSEDRYWAKGVTSCATCDGFFFKGKDVCVIGGGDSAMEEATFLTRFCTRVYLLHRRNSFRASKIMTERALANAKITPMYDVVVDEVLGDGAKVTGVRMRNLITKETLELPLSGLFLAIGHIPNSDVLKGLVDCNEEGYVRTKDKSTYTNVEGIFACGDVADHVYRQAITAAGTGCQAAIDAERWLETQGV